MLAMCCPWRMFTRVARNFSGSTTNSIDSLMEIHLDFDLSPSSEANLHSPERRDLRIEDRYHR
jgi:hypothetical protein